MIIINFLLGIYLYFINHIYGIICLICGIIKMWFGLVFFTGLKLHYTINMHLILERHPTTANNFNRQCCI